MTQHKQFATIVADFPWPGHGTDYATLSLRRLRQLPIAELGADSSHLWLWATNSTLVAALELGASFGYTYRGIVTWLKSRPGRPTRYLQANTEHLLFFTKGDAPAVRRGQTTGFLAPNLVASEKPAEAFAIIERVSPPPYLELFARQRPSSSADWSVFGDELESDISIPGFPVPSDFTREDA